MQDPAGSRDAEAGVELDRAGFDPDSICAQLWGSGAVCLGVSDLSFFQ